MNTKALASLADLICRAQGQGRTPMGIAFAIDSAGRHMTPELAAELERYRAMELGDTDGRVSATCADPGHPTWLRTASDDRACPWCRVAELEALTPAAVQTCRKCGAGYSFGEPCQTCAFEARMAAEVAARAERPVNRLTETFMPVGSLREEDEFHLRHDDRTGRDLPETGGAQ